MTCCVLLARIHHPTTTSCPVPYTHNTNTTQPQVFPTFELCIQEAAGIPEKGAEGIVLTEDFEADDVRAGVEAPRSH